MTKANNIFQSSIIYLFIIIMQIFQHTVSK